MQPDLRHQADRPEQTAPLWTGQLDPNQLTYPSTSQPYPPSSSNHPSFLQQQRQHQLLQHQQQQQAQGALGGFHGLGANSLYPHPSQQQRMMNSIATHSPSSYPHPSQLQQQQQHFQQQSLQQNPSNPYPSPYPTHQPSNPGQHVGHGLPSSHPGNLYPQRSNSGSNGQLLSQAKQHQASSLMTVPLPSNLPPQLPPPNPKLPNFIPPDQLPPWARNYANNPAVLQLLFRDKLPILHMIGKIMVAVGRTDEGIPGFPGSSRPVPGGQGGPGMSAQVPSGQSGSPTQISSSALQLQPESSKGYRSTSASSAPAMPDPGFESQTPLQPNQQLPFRPSPAQPPFDRRTPSFSAAPHPLLASFSSGAPFASSPSLAPALAPAPTSVPTLAPPQHSFHGATPPEWVGSLNVTSALPITRVEALPKGMELQDPTFGGALPKLSELEIKNVERWVKNDKAYAETCGKDKNRTRELMEKLRSRPGGIVRPNWWETDESGSSKRKSFDKQTYSTEGLSVIWPEQKKARKEERLKRKEIRFTKAQMTRVAEQEECLVPIRLEIDHEPFKFRDTFTWNASDPVVTVELFAQTILDDFHLPSHFHSKIVTSINDQLAEFRSIIALSSKPIGHSSAWGEESKKVSNGILDEEDAEWWSEWRRSVEGERRKSRKGKARMETKPEGTLDDPTREVPLTTFELSGRADEVQVGHDDMRILVKLDITIGSLHLLDAFEWDVSGSDSLIEQFAEVHASDLGLTGEFKTAIAHDIREQVQAYTKSLILVGHPFDGTPILDDDLRVAFLPSLTNVVRSEDIADASYTPIYRELDPAEMDSMDKEREKELRRKKRQTRGRRGVNLPDRDPKTTKRSLPGLKTVDENGNPIAAPLAPKAVSALPPPLPSKRAAARLASASIASIAKDDSRISPAPSPSSPYREPSPYPLSPPSFAHETPNPPKAQLLPKSSTKKEAPKKERKKTGRPVGRPPSKNRVPPPSVPSVLPTRPAKNLYRIESSPAPEDAHFQNAASPDSLSSLPTTPESSNLRPETSPARAPRQHATPSRSPSPPVPPSPPPLPPLPPQAHLSKPISAGKNGFVKPPSTNSSTPPEWLQSAAESLRKKYPDDNFQIIPKPRKNIPPTVPVTEWRFKCHDCPGRVYEPGVGPELDNFVVHLNNRNHRANVSARLETFGPAEAMG